MRLPCATIAAVSLVSASGSFGAFHLIDVHEIFTSPDGSVQFIELVMSAPGQNFVSSHSVRTFADGVLGPSVTFPSNVANGANQARILLATAGFGSLPGGLTPDLVIPSNFFNPNATTVAIDFGPNIDVLTVPGVSIPRNGVSSLVDDTPAALTPTLVIAVNSPRNNADAQGSVNLAPATPGDFNNDSLANAQDIDLLFDATQGSIPPALAKFDLTGDGNVNSVPNSSGSDADHWVRQIKHSEYGDITLDGFVNFDDLLSLAQNYGQSQAGWAQGNIDGAGGVDFDDLLLLAQNYGFGQPADKGMTDDITALGISFAADFALARSMTPEPALFGSLAFAAGSLRRRR